MNKTSSISSRKMMQFIGCLLLSFVLFTVTGIESVAAQQDEAQKPILGIVSIADVEVSWYPKVEMYAKEIAKAAQAANLKGGYGVYTSDWDFLIYRPIPDFAAAGSSLEKAVAGTPGEQILDNARKDLYGLHSSGESEIVQFLPELSYFPAGKSSMSHSKFIDVQQHWLIANDGKEYVSLIKAAGDFFEKIDYPVEVQAYRSRIGKSRIIFVFHFNDLAAYHTQYAPEMLAQNYSEFRDIVSQMMTHIEDYKSRVWTYRPDLSYTMEM